MGILSSGNITTYIFGKRNGQVVYKEEFNSFGSITGSYQTIDQRITYLDGIYPGLEWEYESWKD